MTRQVPSGAQHAPVGCAHGFGSQSVSAPNHESGARHNASVVTMHAPSGSQHAPTGIVNPTPSHVTEPNDSLPVKTTQILVPEEVGSKRILTTTS